MENDINIPRENAAVTFDSAYNDMLKFRESFLKLSKPDQERLIKAAVPVWAPKADPIKKKVIISTVLKLLG